jgi:hypothetical protein
VLLMLSGQEKRIKAERLLEWSAVATWDPEARYKTVGQFDSEAVAVMLASVIILVGDLDELIT